mgnify:CR=1 FL=1
MTRSARLCYTRGKAAHVEKPMDGAVSGITYDIPRLLADYTQVVPDPSNPAQRVAFGTSGHRGTSSRGSFNEAHILAITQAVAELRAGFGATGPLFIGMDTHALAAPAHRTALEVLAANGVQVVRAAGERPTPTPVISRAILAFNADRTAGFADGLILTPSHNPPEDGGIKYNPPSGGPAEESITPAKQARLIELAQTYLQETATSQQPWRIDVVAIQLGSGLPHINHLENAVGW